MDMYWSDDDGDDLGLFLYSATAQYEARIQADSHWLDGNEDDMYNIAAQYDVRTRSMIIFFVYRLSV